jgi:hypothetical protein
MWPIIYIQYNGGEIFMYADPLSKSLADYGNLPTFTDGELILYATVDDGYSVALDDFGFPVGDGYWTGFGSGKCDFVAGTQLDALVAAGYLLENWDFTATVVDESPIVFVPDGFHRLFDVKLVPPNDPTATERTTWGKVKDLYQQ